MKRIHFVGIKGVAMTALAVWYREAGFRVTGSDVRDEFPTDTVLAKAGIEVIPDFDPRNLGGKIRPDLVIYTGAHEGQDNPEVVEAQALGIRTLPHGKALGEIMHGKRQISVAGSHGKTTTTAMIATILAKAGRDPSWAIGCGEIRGLGLPGHYGRGNIFVAEADEYVTDPAHDLTPRFLWQHPDVLVITNIDWDHPDVYPSLAAVQGAFDALAKQSNHVIAAADADVRDVRFGSERTFFSLYRGGVRVGEFTLKVPGRHNAANAALAAVACSYAGVSWEDCKKGLLAFGGTKRRFELVGKIGGIRVYDDYAHHPSEITATIAAARAWYPRSRIIAVFQPHTYSRTKALMHDFARAFGDADEVILTDIYASAREKDSLGISGKMLAQESAKYVRSVYFAPDYAAVEKRLRAIAGGDDVIICMGAGDIYGYSRKFIS